MFIFGTILIAALLCLILRQLVLIRLALNGQDQDLLLFLRNKAEWLKSSTKKKPERYI